MRTAAGSAPPTPSFPIIGSSSARITFIATHCEANAVSGREKSISECLKSSGDAGIQKSVNGEAGGFSPGITTFQGTNEIGSSEALAAAIRRPSVMDAASRTETTRMQLLSTAADIVRVAFIVNEIHDRYFPFRRIVV